MYTVLRLAAFCFETKDVRSVVCQCVAAKIEICHGDRCGVLWQQCGKCLVGSQLQERDRFMYVASNLFSLFGRGDMELPFSTSPDQILIFSCTHTGNLFRSSSFWSALVGLSDVRVDG